jgi:uridine kinase
MPEKLMTAEQFTARLIGEIGNPFRVRIAGYPACGKTTISKLLMSRLPGAKHVESEAWICSLAYRKNRDLSGANPEGYERQRSVLELRAFFHGIPLSVEHYDHHLGERIAGHALESTPDMPVILDGTLFSLADYDDLVPACVFLRPASLEEWLEASIRRDVETRSFSKSEAVRHNMRKARDIEDVFARSPMARVVTCHISPNSYYYKVEQ